VIVTLDSRGDKPPDVPPGPWSAGRPRGSSGRAARSPVPRPPGTLAPVTTPDRDDDDEDGTAAGPLGSATAPPDDTDSGGAPDGPASGQAGPSWPPAGTEPDAH
jgi:hypothetical protein